MYVAQMNLLRLPQILRQVCLRSEALPASKLTMANLWVGGHSMKNGLHFDVFDNLLHQLSGRKRALLFPPSDTPHLYYALESGANIRRHSFSLEGGKGFSNETVHEAVRKNVAVIDVFDDAVAGSHPAIGTRRRTASSSPREMHSSCPRTGTTQSSPRRSTHVTSPSTRGTTCEAAPHPSPASPTSRSSSKPRDARRRSSA